MMKTSNASILVKNTCRAPLHRYALPVPPSQSYSSLFCKALAEILRKALEILPSQSLFCSEAEMLRECEDTARSRRYNFRLPISPEDMKLVVIYDCIEAPMVDMSGGASIKDASNKSIAAYVAVWKYVTACMQENPDTILVVGSNSSVYKSTLQKNNDLFYRICRHHIYVPPRGEDAYLQACIGC